MARSYQQYLTERGLLNKTEFKEDIPFSLKMIGSVDYKDSFLLMPVKKDKKLTGYSDALEILKALNNDGVSNINFEYISWVNGGFNNRVNNKVSLVGALGNKKEFNKLISYIVESDISFYPDVDFLYVKNKKGFNVGKNASKSLTDETANKYDYNLTYNMIDRATGRYLVKPYVLLKHITEFINDYKEFGNPSISVSSLGTDLNSDFGKINGSNREHSQSRIKEGLESLKSNGYNIASSGANAYTLKYLSHIYDMPEQSSEYFIADRSVPFLQIVTHGFVSYSGQDINLSGNKKDSVLKALELGASPSFLWTYTPNHEIKDTAYNYYSTGYENWYKDSVAMYSTINDVLTNVQQAVIVRHEELVTGVFKTTYNNGVSVFVNYNENNVTVEGVTVAAKGHAVLKGGAENG